MQFYGSGSVAGMVGLGAYGGAGLTGTYGAQNGALNPGLHGSGALYAEGDVGAGPGGSVSGTWAPWSSSGSASLGPPKLGVGEGLYGGGGIQGTVSATSGAVGCHVVR